MLVTSDPFLAEFDRLAQQMFGDGSEGVSMPVDVLRRGEELLVRVDVPGVPSTDIGLDLSDHVLTVSAERSAEYGEDTTVLAQERFEGAMTRKLRVPDWVDAEQVHANYLDGVLTIVLPMAEKARPRTITIEPAPAPSALSA